MPLFEPHSGFEPVEKAMEIRGDSLTGRTTHVADTGFGLEGAHGFSVRYRLSPRFLLSNTLGASDMNYLDVSHAESLAFFYPEEAAKSLRERFEDVQRGGSR